jgi:thioredoxin reductase (NADPH)
LLTNGQSARDLPAILRINKPALKEFPKVAMRDPVRAARGDWKTSMAEAKPDDLDCLVIGGGPAGLTAAIYLARYRRNVMVIDSRESRAALIPETHNYPGFAAGVSGRKLLELLTAQANTYGVKIVYDRVESLRKSQGRFEAVSTRRQVAAKRVVLATGLVDRTPEIPGLRPAIAEGVIRYCPICDGFEASDLRIAVLGPAEFACNKALFLRTYSKAVTLLAADDKPRDDEVCRKLSQAAVRLPCGHAVGFERHGREIVALMSDGSRESFDVIYPVLGCDVRSDLAAALGARHAETGCLEVDAHQRSSVEGLYAAGDVVSDLHQIAVGTGHAALAATHIHNSLPHNFR